MKTTIDIADSLLATTRKVAAREGITVRQLVEEGLRRVLEERDRRPGFRLRRASYRGEGLQPPFDDGGGGRWRDAMYEGRGS